MHDEQLPQPDRDTSSPSDATPPAFTPAGRTVVLSTPYGQAVNRTSVFDAVRDPSAEIHTHEAHGTENLTPVTEEATPSAQGTLLTDEAADSAEPANLTDSTATSEPEAAGEPETESDTNSEAASTADAAGESEPTQTLPFPEATTAEGEQPTLVSSGVGHDAESTAEGEATTQVSSGVDNPAQGEDEAEVTDLDTKRKRRWPLWAGAAAALVLLGVGGGGYAYAAHYDDVAVPRTTVGGVSVAGMSRDEIASLVAKRAKDTTVTLDGAVTSTATLPELGTTVDAQATADAALRASSSFGSQITALFNGNAVSVVAKTDADKAQDYAKTLLPEDESAPVNATVTLGEDGTTFTTTAAKDGQGIDAKLLATTATKAATTLSSQKVTTTFVTVQPTVSDAEAAKTAETANKLVATQVTLTGADASQTFTPDAATLASWVVIKNDSKGLPTVSVDAAKVTDWVNQQSAAISKDPVNGVRNINSRGEVVLTRQEAVDGVKVLNAADIASQLTSALNKGEAYTGAFTTEPIKASWDEKKIADGAENLPYQAAADEKWIDINLTKKTVTAYVGATVAHGPVTVVDGAAATPTVTGTYKVTRKVASETMRGTNADGSKYETKGVPWATYFYSGYAFHGAPWRSSFGYSGSHGCLNMPVPEAKWIYDWAPVGTPVVSHR